MFFLVGRCLFIILDGPGSWMWRWRSLAASGSPSCKTCGWKAHKISVLGGGFCFLIFPPRKGERGRGWGVEGGVVILGDQIFISEIQVSTIFCLANNFVSLPFVGIFYFLNCFLKRNFHSFFVCEEMYKSLSMFFRHFGVLYIRSGENMFSFVYIVIP